jgi:hypothetical protein
MKENIPHSRNSILFSLIPQCPNKYEIWTTKNQGKKYWDTKQIREVS